MLDLTERIAEAMERNAKATENIFLLMLVTAILVVVIGIAYALWVMSQV